MNSVIRVQMMFSNVIVGITIFYTYPDDHTQQTSKVIIVNHGTVYGVKFKIVFFQSQGIAARSPLYVKIINRPYFC